VAPETHSTQADAGTLTHAALGRPHDPDLLTAIGRLSGNGT